MTKDIEYRGGNLLENVLANGIYYWKTSVPRLVKMREIWRPNEGERAIGSK